MYVARVKDAISTYIIERKIGILEINRYLDELSDYLQERIEPVMAEYGISLTNFFVNDISVPEDDPAVVTLKQALAKRAEMELLGYTYVQERSFDTLEGAATNPGSTASDLMGAGLGLGMGIGMGGGVGGAFADVARNLNVSGSSRTCPSCGSAVPSGQKFCGSCGWDMAKPAPGAAAEGAGFCTECGAPLAASMKFCGQCGTSVARHDGESGSALDKEA